MLNLLSAICFLSKDRKYYYPELYTFNTKEEQIFKDERHAFHFINAYLNMVKKNLSHQVWIPKTYIRIVIF
jgi:hypothetical protein